MNEKQAAEGVPSRAEITPLEPDPGSAGGGIGSVFRVSPEAAPISSSLLVFMEDHYDPA